MASYSSFNNVAAPELEDYEAKTLPTYQAQEDKVNETYDAKQASSLAALESAYNQNMMDYQATLDKIPATYQKQRNETEAEYEKQRAAYNQYANANGINSGAGSQAQLAYSNQLQSDMNDIGVAQANATANAQLQISKLKQAYQDDVAAAVKENDYERAAALLQEYQTQAKSVVDVAQAQADEYYRAYQSAISNKQYLAEWNRTADAEAYDRALDKAEQLAAYGDFSGYYALGYTDAEVAEMENYWNLMTYGGGSSGSSSGSSSRGSSGSSGSGGTKTDDTVLAADVDKAKAYAAAYAKAQAANTAAQNAITSRNNATTKSNVGSQYYIKAAQADRL